VKKNTRKARNTRNTRDQLLYPLVSFQVKKINKKIKKIPETQERQETQETRYENYGFKLVRELSPGSPAKGGGEFPSQSRAGHQDSAKGGKIQFPHEQGGVFQQSLKVRPYFSGFKCLYKK
jgi:hypothetical protein